MNESGQAQTGKEVKPVATKKTLQKIFSISWIKPEGPICQNFIILLLLLYILSHMLIKYWHVVNISTLSSTKLRKRYKLNIRAYLDSKEQLSREWQPEWAFFSTELQMLDSIFSFMNVDFTRQHAH